MCGVGSLRAQDAHFVRAQEAGRAAGLSRGEAVLSAELLQREALSNEPRSGESYERSESHERSESCERSESYLVISDFQNPTSRQVSIAAALRSTSACVTSALRTAWTSVPLPRR